MDRVARVALAGWCMLALGACSSGGRTATGTTTAPTTAEAPSTTAVPSTTSAPTTTLSPQQRDEAEIRELHDRFFRMMEESENPPDPGHPSIAATTTGIQQQRSTEWVQTLRALGQHGDGDIRGEIQDWHWQDMEHVVLESCTVSTATLLATDGSIVDHDPTEPRLTELRLVLTSAGWRVEDWLTGGHVPCTV